MNLKKFIKKFINILKKFLLKQVYKLSPLMTYKKHYIISQRSYNPKKNSNNKLYNFTYLDSEDNILKEIIDNDKYKKLISRLNMISNQLFAKPKFNCWFPKNLNFKNDNIYRISHEKIFIPEIKMLINFILPTVEKYIFNSYALVEGIYWYRTFENDTPDRSSFLWHFDNSCLERVKIMLYLNEVNSSNGPFTYLYNDLTKKGFKCKSSRIDFNNWESKNSRLNENEIGQALKDGYVEKQFLGEPGSFAIFNTNIAHRGSKPFNKDNRDAIVIMLRPFHKKLSPIIHKEWTGTNMHKDNNINPRSYKVKLRK